MTYTDGYLPNRCNSDLFTRPCAGFFLADATYATRGDRPICAILARLLSPIEELSPAQRAGAIKRRREIWTALHPETTTNCRGLGGRGKTEFASETAKIAGDNVRDVQRHLARADALGDDLTAVAGTSLDKGVELDALKAMPPEQRAPLIARAQAESFH